MATVHPIMIEDDDLSVGYISDDISFVGGLDDFFQNAGGSFSCDEDANVQSPEPMSVKPSQTLNTFSSTSGMQQQPRLVSVSSMSQVSQAPTIKKSSKLTPLDSLRELVSKKQKQTKLSGNKRVSSQSSGSLFASVFGASDISREAIQRSAATIASQPALKKIRTAAGAKASPFALHEACRGGVDLSKVEDILAKDPGAALRAMQLKTSKKVYNPITCKLEDKVVSEKYVYPLNLAISYKAPSNVLERLVSAAPQVLSMPDNKTQSLHILLRHKPEDVGAADVMLLKQPTVAGWTDTQENSALHVAVSHGACSQTIRHLVIMHPEALMQRNRNGKTPLELSQLHSEICSGEVADYLWTKVQEQEL